MKRLTYFVAGLLALAAFAIACNGQVAKKPAATADSISLKSTTILPDDQVVAWVNNTPIPKKLMDDMIARMPAYMKPQLLSPDGMKNLVDNLVGVEVVYEKAAADGALQKAEMQEKLQQVVKQIVFGEFMQEATKDVKAPDEAAMRKFYDSTPQLASQKYEEVKEKIAQFLMQQAQQEAIAKIVNDLKAKASVKLNDKVIAQVTQAATAGMPQGMGGMGGMGGPGMPPPSGSMNLGPAPTAGDKAAPAPAKKPAPAKTGGK
jgi:hypothetical protein